MPKNSKERFHAKMGTIMDRNSKNLTEAKEINKRWQRKKNKKKRRGGKNTQKKYT